jgi:hypothetical protein
MSMGAKGVWGRTWKFEGFEVVFEVITIGYSLLVQNRMEERR